MFILQVIYKLIYNIGMVGDFCIVYYYRNLLGYRSVKGLVKNVYRVYKMFYYIIFDVICVIFFMDKFGLVDINDVIFLDFL